MFGGSTARDECRFCCSEIGRLWYAALVLYPVRPDDGVPALSKPVGRTIGDLGNRTSESDKSAEGGEDMPGMPGEL